MSPADLSFEPAALRRIRVIGVDGTRNLMLGLKALRMVDANVQRGREAGHPAGKVVYRTRLDRAQPVIEPNHRAPSVSTLPILFLPLWINK